ncbi:uncharacterized protein BT62DRAFT_922821 [Guyanagaster necrorhizus]|uniref:Uncharacterized protein n=1 Tax=Guyanagaster necrorhizus TaxID=856835 RepID=A0A9P7VLP2_9AGAR|nr:uncharacterized protein BT62DRAFT_922821 [Guyanagaster necrorhizus MCA 3950]KAG7442199.1 hypothetical protein BT62DRAFT_922821 [Guyanagaster necrorhizus MCA 3950]
MLPLKSPSLANSARFSISQGSNRFRESTRLIPSRISEDKRYKPLALSLPVVVATPLSMLALGVALEIGVNISNKNQGAEDACVPDSNPLTFLSTQFLLVGDDARASVILTLYRFIIPMAFLWRELDWYLRWYQPYVVLSRGNASVEEGILSLLGMSSNAGDVRKEFRILSFSPFFALFYSSKFKHRVVFWSAFTACATYLLQPLASSIFQIQQRSMPSDTTVTSTRTIGLAPDVDQLNAFVAAAGFAEAAAFNNLTDPPFIQGGWATAEFTIPSNNGLNATIKVDTTGIQTQPNCENARNTTFDETTSTIESVSISDCAQSVPVNTSMGIQYGVVNLGCGSEADLGVEFQPVMFWYFHQRSDNEEFEARTVFCAPSIQTFNVIAQAYLQDRTIAECELTNNYTQSNNVTGAPLFGHPFNAVVFNSSTNPFIQARANATNTAIPGTVFRFASQLQNGPQSTFDLPNGFLDITTQVYTQHLALTAKNIYFVAENRTIPAQLESYVPRLVINSLPGHALALLLFVIGFIGTFLHIINRRQRRHLFIASPPGSIGGIVSMTSHSGFGQLLVPYDSEESIERKLKGLRFRLDKRTGAIVAEDDDVGEYEADGDGVALLGVSNGHARDSSPGAFAAPTRASQHHYHQ